MNMLYIVYFLYPAHAIIGAITGAIGAAANAGATIASAQIKASADKTIAAGNNKTDIQMNRMDNITDIKINSNTVDADKMKHIIDSANQRRNSQLEDKQRTQDRYFSATQQQKDHKIQQQQLSMQQNAQNNQFMLQQQQIMMQTKIQEQQRITSLITLFSADVKKEKEQLNSIMSTINQTQNHIRSLQNEVQFIRSHGRTTNGIVNNLTFIVENAERDIPRYENNIQQLNREQKNSSAKIQNLQIQIKQMRERLISLS